MILVKFDHNYSDEYDVIGFRLFTLRDYELMIVNAREAFILSAEDDDGTISCGWGGNDQIIFESYDEWRDGLTSTEISSGAFNIILDTIGNSFGHCLIPEW